MRRMLTTGFGVHRRNVMREDDGSCTESTAAGNPVRHIHHHAYACWDSDIATLRSKWREMRRCSNSSASWMRLAARTFS